MRVPRNFADEAHAAGAYFDPTDPERRELMGATTVIKRAMPPYLVPWAAKLTATEAVETIDQWRSLDKAAAIDLLKGAPDRARDKAGDKGTITHRFLKLHAAGEITGDEVWDADAMSYIAAGLAFLRDWRPRFVWQEATVFSPELGYAGTLDFIADIDGIGRVIGDYKSSNGIYAEVAAQLASYRFADHAVDERGERLAIPDVTGGIVVHLKGDGTYDVRPVLCDESAFEVFRHSLGICAWKARNRGVIGSPLPIPEIVDDIPEPDSLTARREWLRERIRNIVAAETAPEILAPLNVATSEALLLSWWPSHLGVVSGLDDAEIDEASDICWAVEKALRLQFPATDPLDEAADQETRALLASRLRELPEDLHPFTPGDIKRASIRSAEVMAAQLSDAESAHQERNEHALGALRDVVEIATQPLPADFPAIVARSVSRGRVTAPRLFSGEEVDRLDLFVEGIVTGFLSVMFEAAEGVEELLLAVHQSKRAALEHTKAKARVAGVMPPKSFAEIAGDPLLIALAIQGPAFAETPHKTKGDNT